MIVTLNERTVGLVREQLQAGRYTSAEDAVNGLIEEHWAENPLEDADLEAALLRALDSPRRVYGEGELLERARLRLATQHLA